MSTSAAGLLLPRAVGAFFANGGRQYILMQALDHAAARTARLTLPGLTPIIPIAARSPGASANQMKIRLRLKRRTLPLRLVASGDADWPTGTLLAPAHRAQAGVTLFLLGIPAPVHQIARIATVQAPQRGVAGITLDPPLAPPFNAASLLTSAQELLLRIDVFLGDEPVGTWDDAAFDYPRLGADMEDLRNY